MVRRRPVTLLVRLVVLLAVAAPFATARAADAGIILNVKQAVVLINDHLVPVNQFRIGFPDACLFFHYHANVPNQVTALDGTVIPDLFPGSCGYGTIPPLRPWVVWISNSADADFDGIPDSAEPGGSTDPDSDNDGIPDGNEDADGDGVNRGEEYWVWGTSDNDPDDDDDGCDDGIEAALDRFYQEYTVIGALIGIYANSGVLPSDVAEVFQRVNAVLRRSRIRIQPLLTITGLSAGDDGSGGGSAGDAMFTQTELGKVFNAGFDKIDSYSMSKGMKFLFGAGNGILDGSTPGVGLQPRRVVVLEPRMTYDLGASTAIHQLGHGLGLGYPLKGSPEDTPGNAMTPSDLGRDAFVDSKVSSMGLGNLVFTQAQRAAIVRNGYRDLYGFSGKTYSPAAKQHYQAGGTTDAIGDQTGGQPAYVDLDSIALASNEEDEEIHVSIALPDRFPASGAVDVAYRLLFDADASGATGATVDGFAGIERELWLAVRGDASAGGLVVSGLTRDHADAARRYPLAGEPAIVPVTQVGDASTADVIHAGDAIEVRIRKELLGLTASDVPVKVIASTPGGSLTSTVRDTATFVYHRDQWQDDPTLTVPVEHIEQGKSLAFTIAGLAATSPYTLMLDDDEVKSGVLDGGGGTSSTFTVPVDAPGGFSFLTALDEDGGFAFSAVRVLAMPFLDGFERGNTSAWTGVVP